METIRIQTAQNVDLEYEIASIGDRILAFILDGLFLFAYATVITIIISILSATGFSDDIWVLMIFFIPAPIMFYDLLCEIFMDGQSFGKKLLKIKVVRTDGAQPTLGDYLLRWLFRLIDIVISYGGVALLTILINGKGQRLGDLAAGTTVIKLAKRIALEDTIFTKVDESHNLKFPQVSDLDDQIISIIKEVLNTSVEGDRHGLTRQKLALRTQKAIESKLKISSGMDARPFLQTIMRDYNHFHGRI